MNKLELNDAELHWLVGHILTFARLDGLDPVWESERMHAVVVGKLMAQTPKAILEEVLRTECADYTAEQRKRMIEEVQGIEAE